MVHTFSPFATRPRRFPTVVPVLLLAVALSLGGCASVPPPDNAMNQAQAQLQAARSAGAADYDPVDLGFAQDKFQQAQAAVADRKYALAADLADESRADALLARTRSQLGAARAQIQSKLDANSQLRAQNEQAQAEAQQHAAQQKAQLAQQQAAIQQQDNPDNGADGNPASSATVPAPASSSTMPAQAPIEDMPAPGNASSAPPPPPPPGQGFQNAPDPSQQNAGGNP